MTRKLTRDEVKAVLRGGALDHKMVLQMLRTPTGMKREIVVEVDGRKYRLTATPLRRVGNSMEKPRDALLVNDDLR